MKHLRNGLVLMGKEWVQTDLSFAETITAIGKVDAVADYDASDCYVVPGFVDIHTHGAVGEDFSDGKSEGLQAMADYYAKHGVTSFLATTMTLPEAVLTKAVQTIGEFAWQGGAKCAGIHLEGPFLCVAKKGAQAESSLHTPDVEFFNRLQTASGNRVKMVTVACEEPNAMTFIQEVSKSCVVSLGHSIANYDTAMEAFSAGATHATHLYNGMLGLGHREPAIIGAALDGGASVELICDGLHIHPAVIRMTKQLYGDKLNLISDSLRCAGMPDGEYELGGQPITMTNGRATLTGTDTLAGSAISLLNAVQNVVRFGFTLEEACYAASTAPAEAAGLHDVGRIALGKRADLLVLDKNLNLKAVFIDGVLQQ